MVTKVALTREAGANEKLAKLLDGLDTVEIPCIMFADGEDADKLPGALKSFDIVVITSPQAASVFIDAWMKAGKPTDIKIATVGKGTSKPLISNGLKIDFEPSDSTAETLALELPASLGKTVLYPSSSLAQETLASGLMERGFEVRAT
jgi:uroporphyrinogen-III synthase